MTDASQTFECGTTQYVALDMVLRSIRNLFSFHTKLYDAIDEAQGDLTLACNKVSSPCLARKFMKITD